MILAVDVHYREYVAKAVGVTFNNFKDATPTEMFTMYTKSVETYIPGSFYKRELPVIMELLEKIDMKNIDVIIIDGYVYLDNKKRAGLGKRLHDLLGGKISVIGVAESSFYNNTADESDYVREIYRGESKNPLYITSVGIYVDDAASYIKNMAGNYRIPTILKLLDRQTKIK